MWGAEAARSLTDLARVVSSAIKRLIDADAKNAADIAAIKNTSSTPPSGLPVGATISWDSDISLPIGYLERSGQAISRTTYSELFALIGTKFGVGDGTTTFNIPNSQGLVLRHAGTQVVGGNTKDGGLLGEVLEDQMQKITGESGRDSRAQFLATSSSGALAPATLGTESSWASSGSFPNSSGVVKLDSSLSPDARTSDTTAGETRVSSISTIFIMKVQNLETESATTSAVDSLNFRVTTNEADIVALETKEVPYILVTDSVTRATTETLNCPSGSAIVGNNKLVFTTETGSSNKATFFTFDVANNEIDILVTGTYEVEFNTSGYRLNRCGSFFYNETDATRVGPMLTSYASSASDFPTVTMASKNTYTLTSGRSYSLYTYAASALGTSNSFGLSNTASAANFPAGNSSVWNWIKITKID